MTARTAVVLAVALVAAALPGTAAAAAPAQVLSRAWHGGPANGASGTPVVSADGRFVVFPAAATNLVPGDTNGSVDIFVKDRATGAITRANTTATGEQSSSYTLMPAITADGGQVFFVAWGDNLVPGDTEDTPDIFVKTLRTGEIRRVNTATDGRVADAQPYQPAISADGRYLSFASLAANLVPGDDNNVDDVFTKDLRTGVLSRISLRANGKQARNFSLTPALSADGRVLAFASHDRLGFGEGPHPDVYLVRPVGMP